MNTTRGCRAHLTAVLLAKPVSLLLDKIKPATINRMVNALCMTVMSSSAC